MVLYIDLETEMDTYKKANLELWNEWTHIHKNSKFYDFESVKQGKLSLKELEIEEVGPVDGKSLLHLQCHFGMDTLSWARLGAKVTGVDFSDRAIELAQSLSEELSVPARFICSDVNDLTNKLDEKFDIVFTSYGVLTWLPDLNEWAKTVSHCLSPGGIFYVVEGHPAADMFESTPDGKGIELKYAYFNDGKPYEFKVQGSYAEPDAKVSSEFEYCWFHKLSDITNNLIANGLKIEFLHEFPYCAWKKFECLVEGADRWWRFPDSGPSMPLMFSLRAIRE